MDAVDQDIEPVKIVISYRRDDASGHAGHLYADLARRFGDDRVFIDIDNIEPGLDFAEVITSAIKSADVLIAVIGRSWLSAADKNGRRKVDKKDDFVRLEIESAITRKLRILPVLVQDAEMPSTEDLPESMATFARRNALEISDKRWRSDVDELIELLEEIARAKVEREAGRQARRVRSTAQSEQAVRDEAQREAEEQAERERTRERERELWALNQREVLRREQEARLTVTQPVPPVPPPPPEPRPTEQARPVWRTEPEPSTAFGPRRPAKPKPWVIGAVAALVVVALLALVAGLVVASGGDDGGGDSGTATDPTPEATTVEVRGDVPWNDTGIDVVEGQTVEIVATGTVETAKGSPSRDSEPDGITGEEFGNNVVPGVRHGALIGMIGRNEPFGVGSYRIEQVPTSGRLYLGVNDRGVENNAGEFTAVVTVV